MTRYSADLEVFDRLPAPIRRALRQCDFDLPAEPIVKLLAIGAPMEEIVRGIHKVNTMAVKHYAERE